MRANDPVSQLTILTICESAEWVRVVFNEDVDDWIAEYRKTDNFPARQWAERIVTLYEQRQHDASSTLSPTTT